jgi:alkylation response protein AidB-like acyl-CoA dehydrogenase
MTGSQQAQPDSSTETLTPEQFRVRFSEWLRREAGHHSAENHRSLEERISRGARLIAALYEAGWNRYGWPSAVGGIGGDIRHRAVLYDELCRADVELPEQNVILEVVGPALVAFAPDVAARRLPGVLRGEDILSQGFSEPESGSDLASLRCRATFDAATGEFVVNGQKIWTSLGHVADHIVLLCRTGKTESRSRGLTMLLVDLRAPGIDVRPIRFANGENELSEVFFHDVRVSQGHLVGDVDDGWSVATYLLQFERGMYAWMRQAVLSSRLRMLAAHVDSSGDRGERHRERLGAAVLAVAALRARSSRTVETLAHGDTVGPAASMDKLLLATAEHAVYDAGRDLLFPQFALDDTQPTILQWRTEWFYSRAASIYGGAAEIQRTIIADRVLDLPRE